MAKKNRTTDSDLFEVTACTLCHRCYPTIQ